MSSKKAFFTERTFFFLPFLWFQTKRTHEEIFKLVLINVVWQVPNEKLVAVWVADNPPVVYVSRFSLSPTTCRTGTQPKKSAPIKQASKINKKIKWTVKSSYLCWQNLNVIFLLVTPKIGHHLTMTRWHKLTEELSDGDGTLCGKWPLAIPGLGPRWVKVSLSRVRWSRGRRGAFWVSGLASALGCTKHERI